MYLQLIGREKSTLYSIYNDKTTYLAPLKYMDKRIEFGPLEKTRETWSAISPNLPKYKTSHQALVPYALVHLHASCIIRSVVQYTLVYNIILVDIWELEALEMNVRVARFLVGAKIIEGFSF